MAPAIPRSELCLRFVRRAGPGRPFWRMPRRKAGSGSARCTRPKVNNIMLDTATGRLSAMVTWTRSSPAWCTMISRRSPLGLQSPGRGNRDWKWYASNRNCAGLCLPATFPWPEIFSPRPTMLSVRRIRLLAFELGLRFFTDYLAGNVYFKPGTGTQSGPGTGPIQADREYRIQATAIRAIIRDLIRVAFKEERSNEGAPVGAPSWGHAGPPKNLH